MCSLQSGQSTVTSKHGMLVPIEGRVLEHRLVLKERFYVVNEAVSSFQTVEAITKSARLHTRNTTCQEIHIENPGPRYFESEQIRANVKHNEVCLCFVNTAFPGMLPILLNR